MLTRRLERLYPMMADRRVDCLVLVPGANLFYLTGLRFHLSERPLVAFFAPDRPPALVLPALEVTKAQQGPFPLTWQLFSYTDEEGPTAAFHRAAQALGMEGRRLAVEYLTMRVTELVLLQQVIPHFDLVEAEPLLSALRMTKEPGEVDRMRRAVRLTEAALQRVVDSLQPGMTEREVASRLWRAFLEEGAEGLAFEPLVLTGPNSALPHALPGDHPLRPGDMLIVDCGVVLDGYISDITRTFAVGEPDPEMARIYQVVQRANEAGRATAGPGVPAQEVDRAARRVIEEAGYGDFFIHRTGHGIGLEVHEPPYIVEGNEMILQPGMTFTIEPGIYLPGRGGVRIEDDVVITEGGCESLTTFPRDLRRIG